MTPKNPNEFSFVLPFDPLRILYGLREKWLWVLCLPLVLATVGYLVGASMAENRYSVSLQLIKHDVPATLQMSESGQSFRPRDLSDDTLLSTTYSSEVMRRTGERMDPPRSPETVKSMMQIAKQRNTSLFYLTAHSRLSAADAVSAVSIWADEVIRFTDNLQREESRLMQEFISEQLTLIQNQLSDVNQRILAFAKDQQFVDVATQTESSLRSLDTLRSQVMMTRIDLDAKTVQIQRYRNELREQSPLSADLKAKREELTFLRGRYTDNNPKVKEKLFEIEYLEAQIKAAAEGPAEDIKNFTGNDLGNNLFLEILALENERTLLTGRLAALSQQLEKSEAEFAGIPGKSMQLSELLGTREQLLAAQSLLESRRKEASFYETRAPGYWRIFQKPSLNEVVHSPQKKKAILLMLLGGVAGGFLALVFATIIELLRPNVRTLMEAAITTGIRPALYFRALNDSDASWCYRRIFKSPVTDNNRSQLTAFWLSHSLAVREQGQRGMLFVQTGKSDWELRFWQDLLDLVYTEGEQVVFYDLDSNKAGMMRALQQHPAVARYLDQPGGPVNTEGYLELVRMTALPQTKTIQWYREFGRYFLVIEPASLKRSELRQSSDLLRQLLGLPAGMIVLEQSSGKTLHRTLGDLESLLLSSRMKRST